MKYLRPFFRNITAGISLMFLARRVGGNIYGLAIDLGSSTLVLRLMDLENGEISDETHFITPRLRSARTSLPGSILRPEGGLSKLQDILIGKLNEEINKLTRKMVLAQNR